MHGDAGVGKSWLLDTSPAPRLLLDAEGGTKFLPSAQQKRLVVWKADRDDPPTADGSWDTCRVVVQKVDMMDRVYQWLNSGKHPFESLGIDQLTEIQNRAVYDIAGTNQMTQPNWGELLRRIDDLVRRYRDLVEHPIKPLKSVVFIAASKEYGGAIRPLLDGQMRDRLPYTTDVVGYMHTRIDDEGNQQRGLLVNPVNPWVAKDRTHVLSQHYGPTIPNPNIAEMLEVLNK